MRISDFGPCALGLGMAVAILTVAACNAGGSINLPRAAGTQSRSYRVVPERKDYGLAAAACPQVTGKPACLVLIQSKSEIVPAVVGWAPADFQARYKLPSGSKGSGQIVAVVDAYDNPNVTADLATYRSNFGLGTADFTKYNQKGQKGNYPLGGTGWGVSIDLDAEMVSASCPKCTIYLIEANGADSNDLQAAEVEAVKLGAHIVSNSWICYGSVSCVAQKYFDTKGVTYLASGVDAGYNQIGAPAAFDSVAAVGGTVLSKKGSRYSETIWSGSGGGCATGIKRPKWQHDTICRFRLANDVAAVASNVAEYDTYGQGGWFTVGGTSVSAPLLAGVFGLAGNATKQDGGRTFWQTAHHKFLYTISGQCGGYIQGQYTTCAGWGSPDGIGAF